MWGALFKCFKYSINFFINFFFDIKRKTFIIYNKFDFKKRYLVNIKDVL